MVPRQVSDPGIQPTGVSMVSGYSEAWGAGPVR
jgi:hypothetical protein